MMLTTSRPEIELLLLCARPYLDTKHTETLCKHLRDNLDWEAIMRLSRQHAVRPMLYRHLKTLGPQVMPQAVWDDVERQFHRHVRRNLVMTKELVRLLNLFEAQGIPAIPYKGPALATAVYGDVAWRQFGDLDILVKRRDVLTVKALLLDQGYQPEFALTPSQERAYLRSSCEYNFRDRTKGIHLEIHWRIVRPYLTYSLDTDRLWDQLEPVHVAGHVMQSLGLEDLLLILSIHGSKHQWERLGWIGDVAQLLCHRRELQWDVLMARAKQLGAVRSLGLGLFLAHDLLGAMLPTAIRQWIEADSMVKSLAAEVCEQLFETPPHSPRGLDYHTFGLNLRERWWDRMVYRCRLPGALTVEDLTFVSLPPYLSGLYYGMRPVRLFAKYKDQLFRPS